MPLIWDTTVALLDALPFRVPDRFWQWQPPHSPLSDVRDVALAVVTYLAIIFGGQRLMSGQKPYRGSRPGHFSGPKQTER